MLAGSIQLSSSICLGFQYLQSSSEDMAQNINYSLWGGSKGCTLCFMAKLLLSSLVWLVSFLSAFSHLADKMYSLAEVFLQRRGKQSTLGTGGLSQKGPIVSCWVTHIVLNLGPQNKFFCTFIKTLLKIFFIKVWLIYSVVPILKLLLRQAPFLMIIKDSGLWLYYNVLYHSPYS